MRGGIVLWDSEDWHNPLQVSSIHAADHFFYYSKDYPFPTPAAHHAIYLSQQLHPQPPENLSRSVQVNIFNPCFHQEILSQPSKKDVSDLMFYDLLVNLSGMGARLRMIGSKNSTYPIEGVWTCDTLIDRKVLPEEEGELNKIDDFWLER